MHNKHIMQLKNVNYAGVEEWKCRACARHVLIDPSKRRRENVLIAGHLTIHLFSPRQRCPKKRQIWA